MSEGIEITHLQRDYINNTCERLTNRLRFVKRDGRFILQQMWQEIHLGTERWEDVPVAEE